MKYKKNIFMISKRTLFILILFIVAIGTISSVSAEDSNGTQELAMDDNVEITQTNELSVGNDDNSLKTAISDDNIVTSEVNSKITPVTMSEDNETEKPVSKISATIKPTKVTTTYNSGKIFQIKVTSKDGPVSGLKLKLKVYTGNNFKTKYVTTDDNGIAKYKTSGLSKGTHKVVIINQNTSTVSAKSVSSSIVINAKKLYIFGQDIKMKQGAGLVLGAYNKQSDKSVKGVKLQIKVYKTAKKYRTFNLVTGYEKESGLNVVMFVTNQLSAGTHKVTVKITSPNYKGSDSGTITIPKSAKNYEKFTYVFTYGKQKFL